MLDSVLEAGRRRPGAVERVTIGFDAVAALAAGRLDAATAFWNAEGVALRGLGVPTREFRVDDFGAPRYPELVLTTTAETLASEPELVDGVVAATGARLRRRVADPEAALDDLLTAVPELDPAEQRAQLEALLDARALGRRGRARPRGARRLGPVGRRARDRRAAASTSTAAFDLGRLDITGSRRRASSAAGGGPMVVRWR